MNNTPRANLLKAERRYWYHEGLRKALAIIPTEGNGEELPVEEVPIPLRVVPSSVEPLNTFDRQDAAAVAAIRAPEEFKAKLADAAGIDAIREQIEKLTRLLPSLVDREGEARRAWQQFASSLSLEPSDAQLIEEYRLSREYRQARFDRKLNADAIPRLRGELDLRTRDWAHLSPEVVRAMREEFPEEAP